MLNTRPLGVSSLLRNREGAMVWGPQLGWGAHFDAAQRRLRLERSAF